VNENVPPVGIAPEFHCPDRVVVWMAAPLFVQMTVSPTWTASVLGMKSKSTMDTGTIASSGRRSCWLRLPPAGPAAREAIGVASRHASSRPVTKKRRLRSGGLIGLSIGHLACPGSSRFSIEADY
jgi:hypothetical protein